ncbi:MAG TPA: CDP-alcohol phosphatidyltransferase family protein [Cryptosporangiaceae bacterium]|nr:CDP-alcohol phosphatidyltransferase family protein [Cryptosporangiaceae bacterium]
MSDPDAPPAARPRAGRPRAGRPTAADFRARHRGGGLFTETVNQRLGAYAAVLAHRSRLAPSTLTLVNLGIGLGASAVVVLHAPALAAGTVRPWTVGLLALLAWQLAYSLDCADGQLARVTGQAGPAGARVDILCDVAVQIGLVAAVSAVAGAFTPDLPVWFVAVFAGTWMINLVTSVLASGAAAGSLVSSGSPVVRLVKLSRDYGAVVTVVGLVLAFVPAWTVWLMVAFSLFNGLFLVASIAQSALRSGLVAPSTEPVAPPAGLDAKRR